MNLLLVFLLLEACKTHRAYEHIMCGYQNEEKPLSVISVPSKVKSLVNKYYEDFDKSKLSEVFFYTYDPNLENSEYRIILFVFDDKKSKILILDGNYNLLWLGNDFPEKPLGELRLLCNSIEKKYYSRDCEIEGGRNESLTIFRNNNLQHYFYSRGYTIATKDYSNKSAIDASVLCERLIKLAGKTKIVKKQ